MYFVVKNKVFSRVQSKKKQYKTDQSWFLFAGSRHTKWKRHAVQKITYSSWKCQEWNQGYAFEYVTVMLGWWCLDHQVKHKIKSCDFLFHLIQLPLSYHPLNKWLCSVSGWRTCTPLCWLYPLCDSTRLHWLISIISSRSINYQTKFLHFLWCFPWL